MIYEQKENINKKLSVHVCIRITEISRAEKYNNWNEKLTRGVQE